MALPDPLDSAQANGFRLVIDGVELPQVMEISGLKAEVDKVQSNSQVNQSATFLARQSPGRPKVGQFTVTRGLTGSKAITDWLKVVMEGKVKDARKTAAVEITDYERGTIKTLNFTNVWVLSVEISTLKAGATETATEKFTLCFDEASVK